MTASAGTQELGERIAQARAAAGLTQRELAERVGYKHASSIAALESGSKLPSYEVVERMIYALDVCAHWLVTGEGSPRRGPASEAQDTLERIREVLRETERASKR